MKLIEVKEIKVYLQIGVYVVWLQRLLSPGMWHIIVWLKCTNISDKLPASVFRKMKALSSSQTMVKFLPGHGIISLTTVPNTKWR
jgi:hypothetical protein